MLLLFGGMHGNEPAGIRAIEMLFRELELEPIHNAEFVFSGSVLGLIGNMRAWDAGQRFIDRDLNRIWKEETLERIRNLDADSLLAEEKEMKEILDLIRPFVHNVQPTEIVMMDIHTTSSHSGIFSITSDEEKSIRLARDLHAPVVTGILKGIQGTTIHFFNGQNMGISTTALAFEAGQHDDRLSVARAYAGIVNALKSIGCVRPQDVENKHDKILIEFSKDLPRVCRLLYKYTILENAKFAVYPGFKSFDPVRKGQLIARDADGDVYAEADGRILMPLYQSQGEDGFFIVTDENE